MYKNVTRSTHHHLIPSLMIHKRELQFKVEQGNTEHVIARHQRVLHAAVRLRKRARSSILEVIAAPYKRVLAILVWTGDRRAR